MNLNNKKSYILTVIAIVAILGFILAVSGSNGAKNGNGRNGAHDAEIKIGGAFGLTGQCAEFGEGELKSVQLAIDEANTAGGVEGRQIKLVTEDTECEYKSTFNAVSKLISVNGVVGLIGPTWGDSFQNAVPLVNRLKIPTITASGAMEAIKLQKQPIDYYFSTWFSGNSEMQVIQDYMLKVGQKNVVVVRDQDPFGVLMSVIFKEVATKKGINLINDYDSVTGTEDYRVILSKVKQDKPDAVFMSFIGPDSKTKFLKQARELGIETPMYSASDIQNETLLKSFGKYMEGVVYSFPKTAGNYEKFVEAYTNKYSSAPQGPSAANAYDAARIMIEAIRIAGPDATSVQIRDALMKVKLEGASTDVLAFNEEHQMAKSLSLVKTIKGGKFVEIQK